jgi:hypothetical protein
MQIQGFILVRAKMSLRPVDSAAARVALHQNAHSRGYKFSREGADPRSLLWRVCVFECLVSEVYFDQVPPRCGPVSPFIVPKGRARVTFVIKM